MPDQDEMWIQECRLIVLILVLIGAVIAAAIAVSVWWPE